MEGNYIREGGRSKSKGDAILKCLPYTYRRHNEHSTVRASAGEAVMKGRGKIKRENKRQAALVIKSRDNKGLN